MNSIINFGLIKNPWNWFTVTLMVLMAAFFFSLASKWFENGGATSDS